jgi:hypothetical protein
MGARGTGCSTLDNLNDKALAHIPSREQPDSRAHSAGMSLRAEVIRRPAAVFDSVRGTALQGFPEEMFLYFAGSGARQRLHDLEMLRYLELRQPALTVSS